MKKLNFKNVLNAIGVAAGFNANPSNQRTTIDPATGVVTQTHQNRSKKRRNFYSGLSTKVIGCKGAKSMSVAQSRRAATKRNNKRKNPRGCK